tara:strand:- start:33 stop:602 length:570 start_codon:yes stop_codon:yes gene_type:complete
MTHYIKWNTEDCYVIKNNLDGADNFQKAMDTLIEKHTRLYEFGLAMSGVQFIGLSMENLTEAPVMKQVGYFLLSICFLVSLFGSTLSYVLIKYITSIRWESQEFVLAGFHKFYSWFRFTELVPYMTSGLFLLTINILSHTQLPLVYCITFNGFSFILVLTAFIMLQLMICQNQVYNRLNDNNIFLSRNV